MKTRTFWLDAMLKIADPVLDALSRESLRSEMPIESKSPREDREQYTYLEAFGRTVVGMAPWLGCKELQGEEEQLRRHYAALVRSCIEKAVDPESADFMNFAQGNQPIVDAAFLAQGILRAPQELWEPLHDTVKQNLMQCMRATRTRKPFRNNWLLFSAIIEAFLHHAGAEDWDPMRIDYAILKHSEWYKGDGWYGDGNVFHFDYYNSFVIQPMFADLLQEVKDLDHQWGEPEPEVWKRMAHYATLQEHLISPEGTYPLVGRSLVYRFGTFQALAEIAYRHRLEEGITPAQVRCGMTSVLERLLSFKDMFDENGWLQVGVCGHQPGMGETYISTGSLYLTTAGFIPLGLPESDPFWSDPDTPWTMKALWNGADHECEHAIP